MAKSFALPRFYPILDTAVLKSRECGVLLAAECLLEAGALILQYRHKDAWLQLHYDEASIMADLCKQASALFVVNDRADYALLLNAGLHIGQDDFPPVAARTVVPNAVLGFSTHNALQLRRAMEAPADYLSLGPIFATSSKEKPDPVVGVDGMKVMRALTNKPLCAIGGITLANARQVLEAKADSVAVISGLLPDKCDAASLTARAAEWLKLSQ
jgi:thiamine-phosphate pyrophosphorylase